MVQALYPIIYVLVFVAIVVAVQALASTLFASRERAQSVNRRLSMLKAGMNPDDVYATLIRPPSAPRASSGQVSVWNERVWKYCQQAGLSISPIRLLAMVTGASVTLWFLSLIAMRNNSLLAVVIDGTASLIASSVLCVLLAWVYVNRRRTKRLKAFEDQMPLALDVINRAIRAGHPVVSAVRLASDEMSDPIGSEFGLVVDETTYGIAFKDALRNFAERSGSRDAHFFAVSVAIQSETGGNLAEILGGLATVIRGRSTLAKRVTALASEGRASAMLLSALPPLLISAIFAMHPSFYTSKFSDPIFWPFVAGIVLLYVLGWVMIHRIINFKF